MVHFHTANQFYTGQFEEWITLIHSEGGGDSFSLPSIWFSTRSTFYSDPNEKWCDSDDDDDDVMFRAFGCYFYALQQQNSKGRAMLQMNLPYLCS